MTDRPVPLCSVRISELGRGGALRALKRFTPHHTVEACTEDDALRIDLSFHLLGTLVLARGGLSRVRTVADEARRSPCHHRFVLPLSGRWFGEACGVPFRFETGDIGLLDLSRPFTLNSEGCEYIMAVVARDALAPVLTDTPRLHGSVLRSASARILADHLAALARHLDVMDADEAEAVGRATVGLMAASLEGAGSQPTPAAVGLKPAIRVHVERYIEGNLSSPSLTPETISRDLDIPRSTLYRAFAPLGGISSHIQARRLDTAWALLTHPEEHRPIGRIAEGLGFDSSAQLSKAFQRRFGASPRKVRQREPDGAETAKTLKSVNSMRTTFERWTSIVEEERRRRSHAAPAAHP